MHSATVLLFDRWKAHRGLSSDRAALHKLGLSHGTAHHWRIGNAASWPVLARMARDLGDPGKDLLVLAMIEKAGFQGIGRSTV